MTSMFQKLFPVALTFLIFLSGCQDHDSPEPVNEEELITTIVLSFQKLGAGDVPDGEPLIFKWSDPDGSSGSATPEIDEIVLSSHSTYLMNVTLLDESKTPAEDISEEVEEEGTEHQFFFTMDQTLLGIQYNDEDENGKPIGLENKAMVGLDGTGSLTVILRHEPDKDAAGVAEGEIENAGGDTDIEAVFPFRIDE